VGANITATQTIYVYAETGTTPNCTNEHAFTITINDTPLVDTPADVEVCDSYTLPALTNGAYFTATNGGGTALTAGADITATQTIYVYAETGTTPNCTNEHAFTITINDTPLVDTPADVEVCDSYTLPALTNGAYFTATNGGGTALTAGTDITTTQTIYVYAETGTTPNCTNEHAFTITINDTPLVDTPADVEVCDSYTLPALTNGAYFTATNGGGTALTVGTDITSTQTIYVYAETGTTPNCTNEHAFTITINDTPLVDTPADVEVCDSYTLPALTNGAYFMQPHGGLDPIAVGTDITTTQTIYVYAETGTTPNCTNEHAFTITINDTPLVDTPADVEVCDSYTLPALTNGAYFTATNGGGLDPIAVGTDITTTQTIYVYAETGTTPNCTNEHAFTITINDTPLVDTPADVEVCDSYTLPALTNGAYFAQTGGLDPIAVGADITTTQTIYVYAETGTTPNCTNEHAFTITINDTPLVDTPADVEVCDSYTLPALTNGAYYATTGGLDPIAVGANITDYPNDLCLCRNGYKRPTVPTSTCLRTVTINDTPLVDTPADVEVCDSYTLQHSPMELL
jgi:hypothetical protein